MTARDWLCLVGLALSCAAFVVLWAICAINAPLDDADEQAGIARRS